MPISLGQYNEESGSEESRILDILNKQPFQAYSLLDLVPKIQDTLQRVLLLISLQYTLDGMLKKNTVKSKNIQGVIYYISAKSSPDTYKTAIQHGAY